MTVQASWESMEALAPEWAALEGASVSRTLFGSSPWHRAWAAAYAAAPDEHRLFAVRRDGILLGIVPIHQTEGGVTFSMDFNVTDYQDALTFPAEERIVWETLLDTGRREGWDRIDLRGIREDSASVPLLEDICPAIGWQQVRSAWDVSPFLELPATWDQYLGGLGKKDRHELRRKFRRLDSAGDVRYVVLDGWSEDTRTALDTFLDLMGKSGEDKAEFLTSDRRDFMADMAEETAKAGALRLLFLEFDGVRTSTVLTFVDRDKLLLYNSGYDPAFSHLSVGLLLKAWSIRYAIETGLREFDFLRGDEPYKYDLGGRDRTLYRYVLTR